MKQTGVYCWRSLRDGKVYVGSAAVSFDNRRRDHLKMLKKGNHHSIHFQRAWFKYGQENFVFEVLKRCSPRKCLYWEQVFIDRNKSFYCKYGYNRCPTAGSSLGIKRTKEQKAQMRGRPCSAETRRKLSLAFSKRRHSEVTKKRIGRKHRGKVISEDHKRRISLAKLGKKLSVAHRRAISKGHIGLKNSPEAIAKIVAFHKGRKWSLETRRRISRAMRRANKRPEVKLNRSRARKKAFRNPATLAKMSASQKRRWARWRGDALFGELKQ